jgi:site-specific DNA-methyltransferase (adenine-specific)
MKYPEDFINKIIQGNCLDIMKEIPDESIDLIITDPPYLTTNQKWDKKEVFNDEVIKELFRVAKDSCNIYIWCGIGEKSQSLIRWFPLLKKYFHFKDLITWKKQRGIGMRIGWLYTREEIMWFVKNNKKFVWNKNEQYSNEKRKLDGFYFEGKNLSNRMLNENKRWTNVWTDINEISFYNSKELKRFRKLHFTPKPLRAIERIIKLHTKENDLILDCFLGSGTTAIASKNLNRNFIGIEIDKNYCEIAKKRLKNEKL